MAKNTFNIDESGDDLKSFENILRTTLDANFSSIMISRAAADWPVVYVNPAFTELTGYASDEVIGKTPSFLQGPKTDPVVIESLRTALAEGHMFHGKTVNYRKDGSEFMMEWKILPIFNSKNQTTHYLAVQRAAEG